MTDLAQPGRLAAARPTIESVLERTARRLRMGAILNAALAGVILLVSVIGGLQLVPDIFRVVHALVLRGYLPYLNGDDAAVTAAALILLFNATLFLGIRVGVLAREGWSLPLLIGLVIANGIAVIVVGFFPGVLTVIAGFWAIAALRRDSRIGGRAFGANPVTIKELRGRMRGPRAFVVLTVYIALMSGLALLLYLVYSSLGRDADSAAAGEIGRVLFNGVFAVELLLIIFIAPAFTSGAITGERERQTYDLLRTTLLSNAAFVIGKLESALGYIVLLLAAGIPLQSLAFLFGGVDEGELLLSLLILLITAVTLGTVGIYYSAGLSRTLTASVRAYSTALIGMFIAPTVTVLLLDILRGLLFTTTNGLGLASPALETGIVYTSHLLTSINPLTAAITSQNLLVTQQIAGFYPHTLISDGSTIPLASPWILFTILYAALSAVLMARTIRVGSAVDADA